MRLTRRGALLMLLLSPVLAQAAADSPENLAAQVNAQIVLRQVNNNVAMMADGLGAGFLPGDLPAECEPATRAAEAGMSTALVRFMQATFNDPAYQRGFEQLLGSAWSAQQLQAFLDRSGDGELGALNAEVMSAPGLQAAQDAHMARLTQAADSMMDADPGLQKALAEVNRAQQRCDAARMEQEAGT
jgi:hypothetical protein